MKAPQPTEIDAAKVEQLMDKAQQGRLTAQEQKRLIPSLKTLLWLPHLDLPFKRIGSFQNLVGMPSSDATQ